jgi:DNA-binding transcriptional regulator GbsR (MarR family)
MNLRALLDWGLVYRRSQAGERRDFFTAEKELWNVFKKTLEKRKAKELNPMLEMIGKLSDVQANDKESMEFNKLIRDLDSISSAADKALDKIIESDSNLLLNTSVKVMR